MRINSGKLVVQVESPVDKPAPQKTGHKPAKSAGLTQSLDLPKDEFSFSHDKSAELPKGYGKHHAHMLRASTRLTNEQQSVERPSEIAPPELAAPEAAEKDIYQRSAEERQRLLQNSKKTVQSDEAIKRPKSSASIQDVAAALTRRLVDSTTQMEVLQVSSLANRELGQLRLIAASCNGEDAQKAQACIKKLEKLISRCNKKSRDLGKEELLAADQKRKERAELEQRAKEIERELEQRILKRKRREQKYLQENEEHDNSPWQLTAAEKAQIAAQAEVRAMTATAAGVELDETGNTSSDAAAQSSAGDVQPAESAVADGGTEAE